MPDVCAGKNPGQTPGKGAVLQLGQVGVESGQVGIEVRIQLREILLAWQILLPAIGLPRKLAAKNFRSFFQFSTRSGC